MFPYKIFISLLAGLLFGFLVGKYVYEYIPPQENFAQAIRQKDGSLILERNPYEKPKKIEMPTGATLIRQQILTIAPNDLGNIKLDFSLIKMSDESLRVVAKSSNGTIISGVDIPVAFASTSSEYKYTMGYIYRPNSHAIFIDRVTKRFVTGFEVVREKTQNFDYRISYGVKVGVRF